MNRPALIIALSTVLVECAIAAPPGVVAATDGQVQFKFSGYDGDPKRADPKEMTFLISCRHCPTEFLKLGDIISETTFKLSQFQFKIRTSPQYGDEDISELTLVDTATNKTLVLALPQKRHPAPGDPDFSQYPVADKKFNYFVEAHLSGDFQFELMFSPQRPLFLAITYFTGFGGRSATEYFVTASGHTTNCIEMPYWSTRDSREGQLTVEQLLKLHQAIDKLPAENTYPPLGELAIFSFRQGESWVTRTCRRDDLRFIHDIIGERKEN